MNIWEKLFEGILAVILILLYFALMLIYEALTFWRYFLPQGNWLRKKVEIDLDL
jgi:hypothetical protein